MEKYLLSELSKSSGKNFSKAVNDIYLITDYNRKQYPGYLKWYFGKTISRIIDGSGEIIFYLDAFEIVGLSILKRTVEEAKICTLLINEDYRKKGYSGLILEDSFDFLGTDKPVITIPTRRLDEFSGIIRTYNWEITDETYSYYTPEKILNGPKKMQKL